MSREARKTDRVWESTSGLRIDRHFGSDRRSESPLNSRVDATLRWRPSYFCEPFHPRTGFDSQVESSPPAEPAAGEWLSALGEAAGRPDHGSLLSPAMPSASAGYARHASTRAGMSSVFRAGRVELSGDSTGDGPRLGLNAFGGCRRVRQSRALLTQRPAMSPPPWTRTIAISWIGAVTVLPAIPTVTPLVVFFAAVPGSGQAAYLADIPGAPRGFRKKQIALGPKSESPRTAHDARLSRRAAVATMAIHPAAGKGRDDAGVPIDLADAEVEGIADRQVASAIKCDVRRKVQECVGRQNAVSVVASRAANLLAGDSCPGYFSDRPGRCLEPDDVRRNGIHHVKHAGRVECHGDDVCRAQLDNGRDNACSKVHAPDPARRRIGNVEIAFPVHRDIIGKYGCLRGRTAITAVGHVRRTGASHRGDDAGVTIDPSNDFRITRVANEDIPGAVKRHPCRIVEQGPAWPDRRRRYSLPARCQQWSSPCRSCGQCAERRDVSVPLCRCFPIGPPRWLRPGLPERRRRLRR